MCRIEAWIAPADTSNYFRHAEQLTRLAETLGGRSLGFYANQDGDGDSDPEAEIEILGLLRFANRAVHQLFEEKRRSLAPGTSWGERVTLLSPRIPLPEHPAASAKVPFHLVKYH